MSQRFGVLTVFALMLSLASLACGGTGAPASVTQEESAQPKSGGTLNLRTPDDPYEWDPVYRGRAGSKGGFGFAANMLLAYKTGPDVAFSATELVPGLAERWEVSPDGKTYTFHIRSGAKFANLPPVNGRELTARDIKFIYEYYRRLGQFKDSVPTDVGPMLQGLVSVDAPDDRTVVMRFSEPYVPFPYYVASEYLPVLPREIQEADGHFKDRVIGTGPFQLDVAASQKGTRWVWKKNAQYWELGKPYLDEVRLFTLPATSTAFAAFQTKQLDYLDISTDITYSAAQELRRANPDGILLELEPNVSWNAYVNTTRPPLNDIRIRKAMALSLNYDEFITTLQGGRGERQMAGIFKGYFTEEEVKRLQPYDPDEARRLVREASPPEGVKIEATYSNDDGRDVEAALELFQAQLKKTGIEITLKPIEASDASDNRRRGNFMINMGLFGSTGGVRYDPDSLLERYHSKSRSNYVGINNPELDRAIEAQRREVDPEKRRELIREAGRIIAANFYAPGFFSTPRYSIQHTYLKSAHRNQNGSRLPVAQIWLDK